jgi:hypothetical protein
MDTAVSLIEAYLRVNGYFTVTEYPIIEAVQNGGYRTMTDLDILAVRFPTAGMISAESAQIHGSATDPALGASADHIDMIIGEVKEGRAELNPTARDPSVLRTALTRFGCCPPEQAPEVAKKILQRGHSFTASGHSVRLVAFGSTTFASTGPQHVTISLGHVVNFLTEYIREHWDVFRNVDLKGPALGLLVLLEKARQGLDLDERAETIRPDSTD